MAVVTLPEAKAHLNITSTTSDAELGSFIARAESAIAAKCGPLEPTATTSRVRGGWTVLPLPVTPVVSLASITPVGGTALAVDDHFVTAGGIVEPVVGGVFGDRWYDVVYSAGRSTLPEDLRLGVLELIRHLWDTQRAGGSRRVGSAGSDATSNTIPGAAYLFPFRVEQLIAPYVQVGI